jgi:hypothetical protein
MQFHTTNGILRQGLLTNISNVSFILLLGDYQKSEFSEHTGVPSYTTYEDGTVFRNVDTKFRRWGITQEKKTTFRNRLNFEIKNK